MATRFGKTTLDLSPLFIAITLLILLFVLIR